MSIVKLSRCAVVALIALCSSLPTLSATFNVTRFDDPVADGCVSQDCSLREAVIAANLTLVEDLILLQSGVYELTQLFSPGQTPEQYLDLDIRAPLQIRGQGNSATVIRGTGLAANSRDARVVHVVDTSLSLTGLTLRDGHSAGWATQGQGGCLWAQNAVLAMTDVLITQCSTLGFGGAISLHLVDATFDSVTIEANSASYGGAIALRQVELKGRQVRLVDNHANALGGGLYVYAYLQNEPSSVSWETGSEISNNVAHRGGGIATSGSSRLLIEPAAGTSVGLDALLLVSGNSAEDSGGGIYAWGALEARWLGLRSNVANNDAGAIYAAASLQLSDSEVAANIVGRDGGGLLLSKTAAGSSVDRSSFVDNQAGRFGGAISTAAANAQLRNVSTYNNAALAGGGIDIRAVTHLRHLSLMGDSASVGGGGSLRINHGQVHLLGSILTKGCQRVHGGIFDLGGNAQISGQSACAGRVFSGRGLGLSYAYFGGRFAVVGIVNALSALRDAIPISSDVPVDVRGWARLGLADSGAYEYDAIP